MPIPDLTTPASYAGAILFSAAATAFGLAIEPWLAPNFAAPYVAAATVAAWLGGFGPGLVATVASTLAFSYFFLVPQGSLKLSEPNALVRALTVFGLCLLVVWLVGRLRRESAALAASEAQLRARSVDLDRSNAELEQFAYVASHDLQEPLRMVASYTELLAEKYKGRLDADADEFIGYASSGAKRMQALINDLLEYSRAGRRPLNLRRVSVESAVNKALQNLEIALRETGATVTCGPLPQLLADEVLLTHVFQNLVGNAAKFHGTDPPRIHISAARQGGQWVFSVEDNGIGIDPRYTDRIFSMFQRLHPRERYPGTGVGLALSRTIVERHGGRIWVESSPGHGSTFRFTLPVAYDR